MDILIIGNGGREHALAWKVAQSPLVETVYVAPGNAGTALEIKVKNVAISASDFDKLLDFALTHHIGLTIVGPEVPLANGIVDLFQYHQLPCFGPTQRAAQLESSKHFAKEFMQKYQIPTAAFQSFTDCAAAIAYVQSQSLPIVIKASGLAAGKGVVIAHTRDEAETAINEMLSLQRFGVAGQEIVIEEFLEGEEASFIVMCDGKHVVPLATSQDHKARDDGDHGPNTGGMGAYSPAPVVTPELQTYVMQEVIAKTIYGLQTEGTPFVGFLYAGLMIDKNNQIKVLEYNCRLGDPETEPLLMRLQSDLVAHCVAAIAGKLDQETLVWDPRPALGVVLTAGGYPFDYRQGDPITGLNTVAQASDYKIFHAGTTTAGTDIVTAGGRVLCVTALGTTFANAQHRAYEIAQHLQWSDIYYRRDIGYRAIRREVI